MKKGIQYVIVVAILLLGGCLEQHFVPDPDDPNLSKFTFRQFITGTCYINDTPYINYWSQLNPPYPELRKVNQNSINTIIFSWPLALRRKDSTILQGKYNRIFFSIPVQETLDKEELLSWNEKQFHGVALTLENSHAYQMLEGSGNLYFVKLRPDKNDSSKVFISGLFNGRIGDSIRIKDGRFDYIVEIEGM